MYSRTRRGPEVEALSPATQAIVAGRGDPVAGGPLNAPPVFASAFHANGTLGYAREGNPTWEALEETIGLLEGGTAVAFSSGMAAVAATLEELPVGARVVVPKTTYVELRKLLSDRVAGGRIEVRSVEAMDTEGMVAAAADADLVWLETLTNPMLEVPEVDVIVEAARRHGVPTVVDATLATPALQRPLELGADVVLHSATKYIGGHSDLLLGVAVARDRARAARLRRARTTLGAVPGTMEAFLALRGLRTLPLRVERACDSAAKLAARLATHPSVIWVRHPSLPDDPSHARAGRLLDRCGAMLAWRLAGGDRQADALCEAVRVFTHATSLGGVESLIERRSRIPGENRLPPGMVRASVGCEDAEDLWADLERALSSTA